MHTITIPTSRDGEAPPAAVISASDVTRREYIQCADGAVVVLYIVQGGGHGFRLASRSRCTA